MPPVAHPASRRSLSTLSGKALCLPFLSPEPFCNPIAGPNGVATWALMASNARPIHTESDIPVVFCTARERQVGKRVYPTGNASLLKTVLEAAIRMAREKMAASNPALPDADMVARQVGVGGGDLQRPQEPPDTRREVRSGKPFSTRRGKLGRTCNTRRRDAPACWRRRRKPPASSRCTSCCNSRKSVPWYASSRRIPPSWRKRRERGSLR